MVDQARAAASQFADRLPPDVEAQVPSIYPTEQDWQSLMDEDHRCYEAATAEVGLGEAGLSPVARVFFNDRRNLWNASAAGQLGATLEQFEQELSRFHPTVQILRAGLATLSPDAWREHYRATLCVHYTATLETAPLRLSVRSPSLPGQVKLRPNRIVRPIPSPQYKPKTARTSVWKGKPS